MNKVTYTIDKCFDCKHFRSNGLLQKNPKYICDNKNAPRMIGLSYWNNHPILAIANDNGEINVSDLKIPDWCPLLEDNNENT